MPGEAGGGIHNAGNLTLLRALVENNQATSGGGVYNSLNGNITIDYCLIRTNSASGGGGGLYLANDGTASKSVIRSSLIQGNMALDGGGLANWAKGSTTEVIDTLFIDNTAADEGGGIYNWEDADLSMSGGRLGWNSADSGNPMLPASGGGLFSEGSVTLMNVTVNDNTTNGKGGGFRIKGGDLTLLGCTVINNTAALFGGSSLYLTNGVGYIAMFNTLDTPETWGP